MSPRLFEKRLRYNLHIRLPSLTVLKFHLNAVDSKFVYSPDLSFELQAFIPKWLLNISTCYLVGISNVTKLSFRSYVVNAMLHCPHSPSGMRAAERSLYKNCSPLKGAVLPKVTSSLVAALIQCQRGLVPWPQLETMLMSHPSSTWDQLQPLSKLDHSSASLSAHFYFSHSFYRGCSREQSLGMVISVSDLFPGKHASDSRY